MSKMTKQQKLAGLGLAAIFTSLAAIVAFGGKPLREASKTCDAFMQSAEGQIFMDALDATASNSDLSVNNVKFTLDDKTVCNSDGTPEFQN